MRKKEQFPAHKSEADLFMEKHADQLRLIKYSMADLLLRIRLKEQLTQREVASANGIDTRTLYNIENRNTTCLDSLLLIYIFYYDQAYVTPIESRWFSYLYNKMWRL